MSSAAAFSGSVPAIYDRHLSYMFAPYAEELVARVPRDEGLRVLELAAGTGIVTKPLREALPGSSSLVATDLNDAMIDYAKGAVPGDGIEWRQADAQALPFEDESFDAAVCAFGFMFLPDKVQGWREARRVLRPGGTLLANVWASRDENPVPRVIHERLGELFPDNPPPFLDTPYGYHDEERLRADLAAAGWDDARLDDVTIECVSESAESVATGYISGTPTASQVLERGGDTDSVIASVAEALAAVDGNRPFRSSTAAIVITATR